MKSYEHTLAHIIDKWDLNVNQSRMPIHIPNTTRRSLRMLFAELKFLKGVEIGVNRGSNAVKTIRHNPQLTLYCVDPWELYDGMHDFDDPIERKEAYARTALTLKEYDNIHIIRKFSMDALKDFEDESLDFVYIDGNHEFPYVAEDIFHWAKKVGPGGLVAGHDYNFNKYDFPYIQVKEVVDAYTKAFKIKPWFVINEGIYPGYPGNFFWVKE